MTGPPQRGEVAVEIRVLEEGRGLPLPSYMTAGAAGADLFAATAEDIVLMPGDRALVSAGFSLALPRGYEAQIRPRSGLAIKHGVTCLNAPGTVDEDYRGPVSIILVNHGREPFLVRRGDRIAQMVIAPVSRATFVEAQTLAATAREAGGFGSTGDRGTTGRR